MTITWYILLPKGKFPVQFLWQSIALFLINYDSERNNRLSQCIQFYYWINLCVEIYSQQLAKTLSLCKFLTMVSSSVLSRNKNKCKLHTMPHAQKRQDATSSCAFRGFFSPLPTVFSSSNILLTPSYSMDSIFPPARESRNIHCSRLPYWSQTGQLTNATRIRS